MFSKTLTTAIWLYIAWSQSVAAAPPTRLQSRDGTRFNAIHHKARSTFIDNDFTVVTQNDVFAPSDIGLWRPRDNETIATPRLTMSAMPE